jgi:hypothetical protein
VRVAGSEGSAHDGRAKFRPLGSTLTGAAILAAYDGGVRLQVNFNAKRAGRISRS